MADDLRELSVKELKALLSEKQIPFDGYFEKSELIDLLLGKIDTSSTTQTTDDKFLRNLLGAGPGLAAAYQMKVESMSIAELKTHLQERGIKLGGALERKELIDLALLTNENMRKVEVEKPSEVSEHLVEC